MLQLQLHEITMIQRTMVLVMNKIIDFKTAWLIATDGAGTLLA